MGHRRKVLNAQRNTAKIGMGTSRILASKPAAKPAQKPKGKPVAINETRARAKRGKRVSAASG
jgi:hypothetical protein